MEYRETILSLLEEGLRNNPAVHALWLEGADGLGTTDEYSDLDIWLDVADGREEDILELCLSLLEPVGKPDFVESHANPHPLIFQKNIQLTGTSPYLLLDICIQSHSRGAEGCTFFEGDEAEYPRVLFDKSGVVTILPPPPVEPASLRPLYDRCLEIFAQRARVVKYCRRGLYPEAFAYYHKYVVEPLVTLARLLHTPRHADYGMVHLSQHLPADLAALVSCLCQTAGIADIESRLSLADTLYARLLTSLETAYGFAADINELHSIQ